MIGRFGIITVINFLFCGCLCWDDDHIPTADTSEVDLDPYQDHIISLNYEKYTMLTRNSADAEGARDIQSRIREQQMMNELRRSTVVNDLRQSRRINAPA